MNPYRRAFMAGHSREMNWIDFINRYPGEERNALRKAFMAGFTRENVWDDCINNFRKGN